MKRYNLIAFRESLNLTQKEFAEPLGFSAGYQSHIELCVKEGAIGYWGKIHEVYGDKFGDKDIWFYLKKSDRKEK